MTNSSSSSFILTFKSKHHMLEELEKDQKTNYMAQAIVSRIEMGGEQLSKKKLESALRSGYTAIAEFDAFMKAMRDGTDWGKVKLTDEAKQWVEDMVSSSMSKVEPGSYVVFLEVGDHDDEGSVLEHDVLPFAKNLVAYFNNH